MKTFFQFCWMPLILGHSLLSICAPAPWTAEEKLSTDSITENAYIGWVLAHHPLAKKAETLGDEAAAYLRKARGNFDPKISASSYRKLFRNELYYDLPSASISGATRLGVRPFLSFVQPTGEKLNPERQVPESGQLTGGIQIPLGKNLITDAARTELQKAHSYVEANTAERIEQINKLVLTAAKAYWKWWKIQEETDLVKEVLDLAILRADQIQIAHDLGDLPAIDTLEARLQAQQREAEFWQTQSALANARAEAMSHLWRENGQPAIPSANLRPKGTQAGELNFAAASHLASASNWSPQLHPRVQSQVAKLEMARTEVQFRRDQLKPELNLTVAALSGPQGPWDGGEWPSENWQQSNLIGFQTSLPLFLRKERGMLQLAHISAAQKSYDLMSQSAELQANVQGRANGLMALRQAADLSEQVATGNRKLLEAEMVRFEMGESSLFQVNYRENQWLKLKKEAIASEMNWAVGVRELGYALGHVGH